MYAVIYFLMIINLSLIVALMKSLLSSFFIASLLCTKTSFCSPLATRVKNTKELNKDLSINILKVSQCSIVSIKKQDDTGKGSYILSQAVVRQLWSMKYHRIFLKFHVDLVACINEEASRPTRWLTKLTKETWCLKEQYNLSDMKTTQRPVQSITKVRPSVECSQSHNELKILNHQISHLQDDAKSLKDKGVHSHSS